MPRTEHPAQLRVQAAARAKGVDIEIRTFPDSTHTAEEAARAVGAELGQIVKSLVFAAPRPDGGLVPVIALIAGPDRVDVARLAACVGEPGLRRATAREADALTGFTIGGIPPFGHRDPVRVVMDPGLEAWSVVWAAAGTPTAVFPIDPATLARLAEAVVVPIAEHPAPARPTPEAQGAERPGGG
jgi:prolyl-tRNA editing enzyme YbaK/EbsC (Cys-tRNA(Pro) deacylase)